MAVLQQQVVQLQVAMSHSTGVHMTHRIRDLSREVNYSDFLKPTGTSANEVQKLTTITEIQHHVDGLRILEGLMHLDNVWMVKQAHTLDFRPNLLLIWNLLLRNRFQRSLHLGLQVRALGHDAVCTLAQSGTNLVVVQRIHCVRVSERSAARVALPGFPRHAPGLLGLHLRLMQPLLLRCCKSDVLVRTGTFRALLQRHNALHF
mmetsp:Transcript_12913/g.35683  ORF Transcript_12913/g.35683 Transcript_12913/m.35683 type:complete len:204 (+) Transcript_12913:287-898(+)